MLSLTQTSLRALQLDLRVRETCSEGFQKSKVGFWKIGADFRHDDDENFEHPNRNFSRFLEGDHHCGHPRSIFMKK